MFIDEVVVEVFGGNGGNGMVAFRREKYVAFGGPAGGNGGKGGSVIFVGDEGKSTLIDLRYKRHIKAEKGQNGRSKSMHGAGADDMYIKVPLGTVVHDEDGKMIGEITIQNQELIVAQGGKGGRGNIAFASHKNPAPEFAENGELGVVKKIKVELKVLADVGLIGYPSVGKSTLISVLSNAKPKIADYPFTTLSPNLGMVYVHDEAFVIADLPGLIENAHLGEGLGYQFLRHIERCRIILHVLDMGEDDPYDNYLLINKELESYNKELVNRPQIVVANKMDLPNSEEKLKGLKKKIKDRQIIPISAYNKTNLQVLLDETLKLLIKTPKPVFILNDFKEYKVEKDTPQFYIEAEGEGLFVLKGIDVERLFYKTDFTKEESIKRFARQLRTLGIDAKLREMGAKHGDIVRVIKYEFEFIDG